MIKLYAARDVMEAHFLRGLLEAQGVKATVLGEMLAANRGEFPLGESTLPTVWIADEDAERAMKVFRDFQTPQATTGRSWTCPNCGEAIEAPFTECWNCGAARPA